MARVFCGAANAIDIRSAGPKRKARERSSAPASNMR